ncbi:unnamed protein product [Symbiodinium microadriaticum]|nr:unnamed protein product [Symbiodinium microadriaticum]CAE7919027.1 unnamed protein product [Symbiodinium sp. KB8]
MVGRLKSLRLEESAYLVMEVKCVRKLLEVLAGMDIRCRTGVVWDLLCASSAMTAMAFRTCEELDTELLCFRGLSHESQDLLFRSVFGEGCEGECGGLMTQEERAKWKEQGSKGEYTVESCHGRTWHVQTEEDMLLDDTGFHGRHHLPLSQTKACQEMLKGMQQAAPRSSASHKPQFQPEFVSVSYENLGGRVIKGTLCGTAYDDDRCCRRGEDGDGTPKAFLFLGRAAVTVGFKYDKSDRQWLKVRMAPGDCLLRFGSARAWCMGVLKIDASAPEGRGDQNPCPFDFVHVKIQDHRRLQQEKPDLFQRCHAKRIDPEDDKFNMNPGCFQYAYTVLGPGPDGRIRCRVVNDNGLKFADCPSNGRLGHGVTMARACYVDSPQKGLKGKGKGKSPGVPPEEPRRRWTGKRQSPEAAHDTLVGA